MISFPNSAVNQASRNAIEQHQAQFGSTTRILRQVRAIEIGKMLFVKVVQYYGLILLSDREYKGKENTVFPRK